ncbi:MAG TPA: superoxide dismutase family protein, partial [Candidatus Limnocylindrales bacterium]|nr:superoxide dismutase family protein [Candidatus Limnocylindrales bacterium]
MNRSPVRVMLLSGSAILLAGIGVTGGLSAVAQDATLEATPTAPIEVLIVNVEGAEVGTATFTEGDDGAVTVVVSVTGLPEGDHGIHVHSMGVCGPS